ncbi:MAG: glycosyltransferase family 2 protein, partial [Chloroflexota bacterium]
MNVQVSIGLPTRNSIQFLSERLESIRQQTFGGWELIVVDSDSTDGTREMLDELAAEDARVRVYQAPKDGIYPNFNRCIQLSNGPFVYIATSDDIMAPDCLEKMVDALLQNPDCDLAHCPMRVLDRTGGIGPDWWAGNSLFARSSGNLLEVKHKRVAPIDDILCLLGDTIYTSVTQLLIKRSLFEKIGRIQVASAIGKVGNGPGA